MSPVIGRGDGQRQGLMTDSGIGHSISRGQPRGAVWYNVTGDKQCFDISSYGNDDGRRFVDETRRRRRRRREHRCFAAKMERGKNS